jgi:hypothetical protein
MGPSDFECHRLQRLGVHHLRQLSLLVAMLMAVATSVHAEIFPVQASLTYTPTSPSIPSLKIESTDGRLYEFSVRPANGSLAAKSFDLILLSVGTTQTRNILEPSLKNWHGYQPFMLGAWDYVKGAEHSTFGTTRRFTLQKERISIEVSISKVDVKSVAISSSPKDYAFNELVLDVHVSNAK